MLTTTIPAYTYGEYQDDDNIVAFKNSFNAVAQTYVDLFNALGLPVYTGSLISGALLDWVGQGLYGIARPTITLETGRSIGPFNTWEFNSLPFNTIRSKTPADFVVLNDDYYKRVLTWNLYAGDGKQFSIPWLKRRVFRFINGANGADPALGTLNNVSIRGAAGAFTIYVVSDATTSGLLNALIGSGVCSMPFQYTFTIVNVAALSPWMVKSGGVLMLANPPSGYPTSTAGLSVGALYSNSGAVTVVGTPTPATGAPPVYFNATNAAQLLVLGGTNLPLTSPASGTRQLWNNSGLVSIS